MKLNVSPLESTHNAFAVTLLTMTEGASSVSRLSCRLTAGPPAIQEQGKTHQKPTIGIGQATLPLRSLFLVYSSENDDFFSRHEHEILLIRCRIVNQCRAFSDPSLLEREPGPGVESVRIHDDQMDRRPVLDGSVRL